MKRFTNKHAFFTLILTALALPAFAGVPDQVGPEDIPNLQVVHEGLFRSGRPDSTDLTNLIRSKQIKTIINLENDMQQVDQEEQMVKKLGVQYISVPINPFDRPSDTDIEQVLSAMQDSRDLPILVHCHHGEDRTGLVVGLYRVRAMGWTPANAYAEMKKYGFHPMLRGLDRYFKEKTSQFFYNLFLSY